MLRATILLYLLAASPGFAQQPEPVADVGQFFSVLRTHANRMPRSLSYLSRDWVDREQWRILARAKMHELLSFDPPSGAARAEVVETLQMKGYTRSLVRYP